MTWLYRFSLTEYGIVGLFLLLYVYYFVRSFRLARQLGTSAAAVIPKFFLRLSYLTLLLIAVLGPSFGEAEGDFQTQGRDVFVLLDVSRSMDATDTPPSRLERAKFDVQQLADTLAGDRLGLILFSTQAFVLSPLTTDHDAFNQIIRDVRTSLVPTAGTDLCAALELAQQKFTTDASARQSARAIVVFSDGEDFGTCDRAMVTRLRRQGINLLTVGVGTESGSPIRQKGDFVRDDQQRIARTRLNRGYLQGLARDSRGNYLEAGADSQYLTALISNLRSLRGRTFDQRRIVVATNKYPYFLLTALILIVIDVIAAIQTIRL
jgi:Ca-activated chloride channel homolog